MFIDDYWKSIIEGWVSLSHGMPEFSGKHDSIIEDLHPCFSSLNVDLLRTKFFQFVIKFTEEEKMSGSETVKPEQG